MTKVLSQLKMKPTIPLAGKYNPRRVSEEARMMVGMTRSSYFQNTITRQNAPTNCNGLVRFARLRLGPALSHYSWAVCPTPLRPRAQVQELLTCMKNNDFDTTLCHKEFFAVTQCKQLEARPQLLPPSLHVCVRPSLPLPCVLNSPCPSAEIAAGGRQVVHLVAAVPSPEVQPGPGKEQAEMIRP